MWAFTDNDLIGDGSGGDEHGIDGAWHYTRRADGTYSAWATVTVTTNFTTAIGNLARAANPVPIPTLPDGLADIVVTAEAVITPNQTSSLHILGMEAGTGAYLGRASATSGTSTNTVIFKLEARLAGWIPQPPNILGTAIPGVDVTGRFHIARPDLWPNETEVDFGDGCIGYSKQGTITASVGTVVVTPVFTAPADSKIMQTGGEWAYDNVGGRTALQYFRGTTFMTWFMITAQGAVAFHNVSNYARTNAPYWIWVLCSR